MLGDEPRALEHLLEVALGQPLALGDHAEAVRAGRLGRRACSRICSGSIIACIGVSASANRDCAQKPQSSAQPPDFALTSEHMSVESPKRSCRASHARSTSASISAWSSSSPRRERLLAGDQRRHARHSRHGSGRDARLARRARVTVLPRHLAKWTGRPGADHQKWGWSAALAIESIVDAPVTAALPIRVLLCDDAEGFRALMRSSLAEDPSIEIVGEAADGEAGVRRRRRSCSPTSCCSTCRCRAWAACRRSRDAPPCAGRVDHRAVEPQRRADGAGRRSRSARTPTSRRAPASRTSGPRSTQRPTAEQAPGAGARDRPIHAAVAAEARVSHPAARLVLRARSAPAWLVAPRWPWHRAALLGDLVGRSRPRLGGVRRRSVPRVRQPRTLATVSGTTTGWRGAPGATARMRRSSSSA